jgi:signal transduction histidine kinase
MNEGEAFELASVYCFQLGSGDCFKVGRTKNSPADRKRGLATGSPEKLSLYREIRTEYASELEKYTHQLLDEKRAENGEFFYVTAHELDDAVNRAIAFVEEAQPLICEANSLRAMRALNATFVEPLNEMLDVYRELRKLHRDKYFVEQQIAFLESKIQVAIGDNSGMRDIASWKWTDRWTMDIERFRREQETLYDEYKRNSGSRRFSLERFNLARAA